MEHPKIASSLIYIAAGLLSACAPIPVATTYKIDWQHRMQSVSHWKELADDTAKSMSPHIASVRTMYLMKGTGRSPFGDGFETYLVDALERNCLRSRGDSAQNTAEPCSVKQGTRIPESSSSAVNISYGVQRVRHLDTGSGRAPPGLFTLLGTGIWLGHQAAKHWTAGDQFVAAIPTGAVLDLISGSVTTPTHTELIVSVVASRSDSTVIFRQDRSYYVDDADAAEYPDQPIYLASGDIYTATEKAKDTLMPTTIGICP
jgi:hypothetical protein